MGTNKYKKDTILRLSVCPQRKITLEKKERTEEEEKGKHDVIHNIKKCHSSKGWATMTGSTYTI
jgi:hypothetical protein